MNDDRGTHEYRSAMFFESDASDAAGGAYAGAQDYHPSERIEFLNAVIRRIEEYKRDPIMQPPEYGPYCGRPVRPSGEEDDDG